MDLSNRRFCKRCRLGKCFQIGMRREYILSDDERAIKRQKIIENRSHADDVYFDLDADLEINSSRHSASIFGLLA